MRDFVLILALATLVSAHFQLNWPSVRGYVEDTLPQYPCGGQNTASSNRTQIPINSAFPIQLHMGHTEANVEVVLALGNSPSGDDFTHILVSTFHEDGPQNFCLGGITVPSVIPDAGNTTITDGMNGTLQVITSGDDPGQSGLYNCADVTFTNTALSPQDYSANCQNSTGVHTEPLPPSKGSVNANGTAMGAPSSSAPMGSASASSGNAQSAGAVIVPNPRRLYGLVGALIIAVALGSGLGSRCF